MTRRLHQISTYLLIALGVVHTSLTPVFYDEFTHNSIWFAGTGLAMVLAGFLNIAFSRGAGRDRIISALCYIANLIFAVFSLLIVRVVREPQAYFGLMLILTMTITAFWLRHTKPVR